jgi:hypothetical protein
MKRISSLPRLARRVLVMATSTHTETAMIDYLAEFGRRDLQLPPLVPGPRSALETRFPRIARELAARWRSPGIDFYIDSLLIDTRGDRMGFPADVLEEIMFLAGVRWYLSRSETPQTMESPRDEFSFCMDGFRRCGGATSWVLT